MAERVGFEPTEPFRAQRFSRPPDSTTLAPLRLCELFILKVAITVIKLRTFSNILGLQVFRMFNFETRREVDFRTASSADAAAVADVYLASRKRFVSFAPLVHSDGEVLDWIRDVLIPKGRVTVVEIESRITGMMVLSTEDGNGWIDHMYVHPDHLGSGIGAQLMSRAKSELGPPIRLYTFQENEVARLFYERNGFKVISYGNGSDNEEKCPDILFEWR